MAASGDRSAHFPAIEAKYGQPMSYWFEVMADLQGRKYPEQIAFLRENHGFSQAHANALVMYSRGSTTSRRCDTVSAFLATVTDDQRRTIETMLDVIAAAQPAVEVVIAWNTPQVKLGDSYIFGISAAAKHLTIAPWDADVLAQFRPRLSDYVVKKKTIQVPSDWQVDRVLLTDMINACAAAAQ